MADTTLKSGFYTDCGGKQVFWVPAEGDRSWFLIADNYAGFEISAIETAVLAVVELTPIESPPIEAVTLAKSIEMGTEDRKNYIDEFGEEPVVGQVGDWDATGWSEAWRAIGNEFDIAIDDHDTYSNTRIAYLKALFATDDVA